MYVYDNFHQKGFKRFQRENDRKRIIRAIAIFLFKHAFIVSNLLCYYYKSIYISYIYYNYIIIYTKTTNAVVKSI